MGLLRSETMKAGTLCLPCERAAEFVNMIGQNVSLEFQDMHAHETVPNRPYKKYVQRIEEMERILRMLLEDVKKSNLAPYLKNDVEGFLANSNYKLDDVESELNKLYSEVVSFRANNSGMIAERNAAIEEKNVVEVAEKTFGNSSGRGLNQVLLDSKTTEEGLTFSNIAGVVPDEDQQRLARYLFRLSRGNSYTNFTQIDEKIVDPATGKPMNKSVFVVYFQDVRGVNEGVLYNKVIKACKQFGCNLYDWPFSGDDARKRLRDLTAAVQDKMSAQTAFGSYMNDMYLRLLAPGCAGNSTVEDLRLFCMKEKSVYATLNNFEGDTTLRCNVWYPEVEEEAIRDLLVKATNEQGSAMLIADAQAATHDAPTYFKTNDFLRPFQEIVNTYGTPRYKELNPALFSCVTFPFIFGIMYGDVGHGGLLFIFSLWLCYNANNLRYSNSMFASLVDYRYLFVLMGGFALYAGFLYNDFFSLGMNLFGSRWVNPDGEDANEQNYMPDYDVRNEGGRGPYPFGVDPAWIGATNELLYLNSMKMKISVCMGVVQMTFGLFIRFSNAIYERSVVDFVCECIPMMIFMVCFFGYMDFMILYKWTHADFPAGPPSLINSLISMAMKQPDDQPLWDGSIQLESTLMMWAMISVPWLLIPKPIILIQQNKAKVKAEKAAAALPGGPAGGDAPAHGGSSGGHGHGEEFNTGEVVIHQAIETIEYVLGTVSHTASYLRQWALSLAHQQLSLVFLQKTITIGLEMSAPINCIAIYFMFGAWFGITLGVLLGMDVLECFLHTLRLHWVEFQSKFYRADGRDFMPYRHREMLAKTVE